jgi:hypothetical protein
MKPKFRKFVIIGFLVALLTSCSSKPIITQDDLIIEKLEPYTLEGIITGKKLYCLPWGLGKLPILKNIESFLGWNTEVMPVDIAVVTAPYNDPKVLEEFYTIMRDRYAWMLPKHKDADRPPDEHVTNNHLLAPTEDINKKIRNLKVGQQVKIKGHLVRVTYPNGAQQTSSQSRTDQGYAPVWRRGDPGVAQGGCEIILVESVQIKNNKDPNLFMP